MKMSITFHDGVSYCFILLKQHLHVRNASVKKGTIVVILGNALSCIAPHQSWIKQRILVVRSAQV